VSSMTPTKKLDATECLLRKHETLRTEVINMAVGHEDFHDISTSLNLGEQAIRRLRDRLAYEVLRGEGGDHDKRTT